MSYNNCTWVDYGKQGIKVEIAYNEISILT